MKKLTLLSVDDDSTNQLIITELFSSLYHIYCVDSGEECIRTIELIKPDVILMDINMPGMDGFETCCLLKMIETFKATPIIFISSYCEEEFLDKIKGVAGDDFIQKPFDFKCLFNKMDLAMKTSSLI